MRKIYLASLTAILSSMCMVAQADEFYANNDITIVVGFSPGGGYDSYARLLARHLGEYIPGNPNIIVQNMPGAGSLTAVRYLDATAPKDGSTIVSFNPGILLTGLVDPEDVGVDFRDYYYLGSLSEDARICYTWSSSGIGSWDELLDVGDAMFGAVAEGTANYIDGAVLHNIFDVSLSPILGFPGGADVNHAIEIGEIDVTCTTWTSLEGQRASDGFVPLVVLGDIDSPELEGVARLHEMEVNEQQAEILDMISGSRTIGKPYILSQDVPEERVAILREAFEAMRSDPEFLADAESMELPLDGAASGGEAQETIDRLYGSSPELVERLRAAIQM